MTFDTLTKDLISVHFSTKEIAVTVALYLSICWLLYLSYFSYKKSKTHDINEGWNTDAQFVKMIYPLPHSFPPSPTRSKAHFQKGVRNGVLAAEIPRGGRLVRNYQ